MSRIASNLGLSSARAASLVVLSTLAALTGCSSGGDTATASGAGGSSGSTTAASGKGASATSGSGSASGATSGSGAGSTSSGAGGSWDAGGPVTPYHAKIGPLMLEAGGEKTQCITYHFPNKDSVYVRRFSTELAEGSHHMILYKSSATTEDLTPTDCQALGGILEGDHPMFIAQQQHSELDLPSDAESGRPVALKLDANQMVKLELHYFNTTSDTITVDGDIEVDSVPIATSVTEGDLAFWGTDQFNIPPESAGDTGVKFQRGLPNTHTFAVTTHQHTLGTDMKVWFGTEAQGSKGTLVVDNTDWKNPELVLINPAVKFAAAPAGEILSEQGFSYDCHWQNTTPNDVTFGESIHDEMCFLWHYYYPSQGFQVCIDGGCKVAN